MRFFYSYLLLFLAMLPAQAQVTRILFIGNSYTYVNNLPGLVQSLALANGDTVLVDSYTPGGYTLQGHSMDAAAIAKIYSQQWDFVILQEQSQRPSFSPAQVAIEVYPYAAVLDSIIHDNNSCTETVFYMTWGRKNGDASNCGFYPPVCTYEGMQARLRESYLEMGLMNGATVSPVGAAWRYMRTLNPAFDLYQADESHPSLYGSYLAACTFYSTIFHKSTIGNGYTAGLSQQEAQDIQNSVEAVVTDSIASWYQYGTIPLAAFTYNTNGNSVQFNNQSLNGISYSWNFGDGNTSFGINPVHTYTQTGSYITSLTASSNCRFDVFTDTIQIGPTALNDPFINSEIYYDRDHRQLIIKCVCNLNQIALYDLQGREVRWKETGFKPGAATFDIPELVNGVYLLRVQGDGFYKSVKFSITD